MLALANAIELPDEMNEEQQAKLDAALTQYKALVTSLLLPRLASLLAIAEQMEKAIILAPEGDRMRKLLLSKGATAQGRERLSNCLRTSEPLRI